MVAAQSVFTLVLLAPLLAQNGGSSLSGRVVNSVTRVGIAGASLIVCRSGPAPAPGMILCALDDTHTAVSDDTGTFHLAGLADGQYLILPMPAEGFFPAPMAKPQIAVAGDTRLDVEMIPFAGLRGRVLDPDGKPAPGVVVALDSRCNGCTAMDVSITNQDGEYSFDRLPPNDALILSASPQTQDPKAAEKIVTTYYPSVIDRDLAQGIRSQGVDLFGYDIKLRTASAHSVRGVVLDDTGKPVPKAIVSMVKPASGMVAALRGAFGGQPAEVPVAEPSETKDDGTFVFPSVLRGNWTLRAVGGLPAHAGSAEVSVADSEVEGIQVRIAPAFKIALQTDFGDSPPAKMRADQAVFIPLDTPRLLPPPPGDVETAQLPPFEGFAGKYLPAPGEVPMGFYLAAVLLDNRDVLGQVTDISAGDSLKLIYKTDGGTVRGTIGGTFEKGMDATIVLMADPGASARLGYFGRADASGAFVLRDIPPGEYTAIAVTGPPGDPARPEFLAMLAASGRRVRVEARSSAQVDLRLARQ